MNNNKLPVRFPLQYLGYLVLFFWGLVTLFLLRQDPYLLDEGAAQSLLLSWSIADQVASSVVTFGAPDLRFVLYLPIGILWTGSFFAAKVFTILLLAFTTWLLFVWQKQRTDDECALLACGLLILSPLSLAQIDSLSPGIFLLLSFVLGAWLDKSYRLSLRSFGGWYFAQLFICSLSVSLHPAGLAYPISLLWSWYKDPINPKQQKFFFIGVSIVVLITLLIKAGWGSLALMQNPIDSLASIILGASVENEMTIARWISGGSLLFVLAIVIATQYRSLWSDLVGRSLLLGMCLGAIVGDTTWGVISFGIILFFGLPLLLRSQQFAGGFLQQRGIALVLIIILSTLFMLSDKKHLLMRQSGILPVQDQLIKTLAEEVESARKAAEESNKNTENLPHIRVASQWPSRTMIACKCDTLPLPPATENPEKQSSLLAGLSYLLFNPQQPNNSALAHNLAMLGGSTSETIAMQNGGALLHFKNVPSPSVPEKK